MRGFREKRTAQRTQGLTHFHTHAKIWESATRLVVFKSRASVIRFVGKGNGQTICG